MEFTKEEASEVVGIVDDNGTSGLRLARDVWIAGK